MSERRASSSQRFNRTRERPEEACPVVRDAVVLPRARRRRPPVVPVARSTRLRRPPQADPSPRMVPRKKRAGLSHGSVEAETTGTEHRDVDRLRVDLLPGQSDGGLTCPGEHRLAPCRLDHVWHPVTGVERRVRPLEHEDARPRASLDPLTHRGDALAERRHQFASLRLPPGRAADATHAVDDIVEPSGIKRDHFGVAPDHSKRIVHGS